MSVGRLRSGTKNSLRTRRRLDRTNNHIRDRREQEEQIGGQLSASWTLLKVAISKSRNSEIRQIDISTRPCLFAHLAFALFGTVARSTTRTQHKRCI